MRTLAICFTLFTLFSVGGRADDLVEPAPPEIQRKPAPPGIVPPAPVPRTVVTIQKKPILPGQERPEASEPATEQGLKVTIQPEQKSFPGNGAFSFEVVLTNESEQPIHLSQGDRLGARGKLVIVNRKTAAQWTIELSAGEKNSSMELAAGKSETRYLIVQQAPLVVPFPQPRPVPLPQPVPFPKRRQELRLEVQKGEVLPPGNGQPIRQNRPAILPVPGQIVFPCGTGPCRAQLFLEFEKAEQQEGQPKAWVGKLASKTVDFEVGPVAEKPIGPPVPPINNNITQEAEAIAAAVPFAEQALESFYQPADPLRPVHKGNWIGEPSKVGQAKKKDDGSWAVQFTSFPRTGFSYNVKISLNAQGFGQVEEVFAGYTPAP